MEQSASISPELAGLFNKVQSQVKDYEEAFVVIRNQKLQLDLLKNAVEDFARTKSEQVEILINEFTNSVSDSLEKIENKNSEILALYSELTDTKKLKQTLVDLISLLNKTKKDFDNIVVTAPDIVRESTESELDRISRKVLTNIRQFDGKLMNLDEKIASFAAIQRRDHQNISDEVQQIKGRLNISRVEENRNQKQTDKAIDILNEDVYPRLDKAEGVLKKLKESYDKEFMSFVNSDEMKNNYNDLKTVSNQLRNRVDELEKKTVNPILPIVAIVIAVVFGILGIVIK